MDVLQNMMLFSELVQCGGNVYTWCYDAQGKLLRSNCPDEAFLSSAFELFGCKQRMLEHGNRDDVPVTLGTALGLLWGTAFEKEEGKLKRVWVIGPVFHRDVTMRGCGRFGTLCQTLYRCNTNIDGLSGSICQLSNLIRVRTYVVNLAG